MAFGAHCAQLFEPPTNSLRMLLMKLLCQGPLQPPPEHSVMCTSLSGARLWTGV